MLPVAIEIDWRFWQWPYKTHRPDAVNGGQPWQGVSFRMGLITIDVVQYQSELIICLDVLPH